MTEEHENREAQTLDVPAEPTAVAMPAADRPRDPVVRVLLVAALSLIAVLLSTGLLIFVYLNTLNEAPRTRGERDMTTWEVAVKERPDDVNAWANLAYAYAQAGRTDDAMKALATAKKVTGRREFVIVEADVLRLAGRYSEAVRAYDVAEQAITEIQAQMQLERQKVGVNVAGEQDALARVLYGRALSERQLGDDRAAIKDLERAVELQPESATMWVALGELYAGSQETSRAQAAFEKALTYVPDDRDALEGLERLEEQGE